MCPVDRLLIKLISCYQTSRSYLVVTFVVTFSCDRCTVSVSVSAYDSIIGPVTKRHALDGRVDTWHAITVSLGVLCVIGNE